MRRLLLLVGSALAAISSPSLAVCSEASVADDFARADYVVRARVVAEMVVADDEPSAEWTSRWGDYSPVSLHRLRITETFKGSPGPTVRFFDEISSGQFGLQLGEEYLLFLYRYDPADPRQEASGAVYVKNTCGPSQRWRDIKVDRAEALRQLSGNRRQ